jgi:hypothetical protein
MLAVHIDFPIIVLIVTITAKAAYRFPRNCPKIVRGKVQVAYFENVFCDWAIFKEAVLLSNQHFPSNSL